MPEKELKELSEKSIYEYARLPRKARLKALWEDGRVSEFYAVVTEELEDSVVKYLTWKFLTLTEEDCCDCFSDALEVFMEVAQDGGRPIGNPEGYI